MIALGFLSACGGQQSARAGKTAGPPQVQLSAVPASIESSPPGPDLPSAERSLTELEERLRARFPDQQGKFVAIETGMHVTDTMDADVDAAETFVVSASQDKTARVWSLLDGKPLAVLRVPGPGPAGELFAVAVAPQGDWVAVGGYEGGVYLFDAKTWHLQLRIPAPRKSVDSLRFSRDGKRLAVGFHSKNGLKIYETSHYQVIFEDADFGADIYGLAFNQAGILAVTSWDGSVRLYSPQHRLLAKKSFSERPYRVAFDPSGKRLVVGFLDSAIARVLSAPKLDTVHELEPPVASTTSLGTVAFSADGGQILAGGRYNQPDGHKPILRWRADFTPIEPWFLPDNTPECLHSLRSGKILLTAQDPLVALFDSNGSLAWSNLNRVPAFGMQSASDFHASRDASIVEFEWGRGAGRAAFDIRQPALLDADPRRGLEPAKIESSRMDVQHWLSLTEPTLSGQRLDVQRFEPCRALSIGSHGFILGCEWASYAFDGNGLRLWKHPTQGSSRGAILSEDERIAVLALDDGTIRWLNAKTGDELVNVSFVGQERDWVAWTPEGFYVGTPAGENSIGLDVQRADGTADFVPMREYAELMRRPDLVSHAIEQPTRDSSAPQSP